MWDIVIIALTGFAAFLTYFANNAQNEMNRLLFTFMAFYSYFVLLGACVAYLTSVGITPTIINALFYMIYVLVFIEIIFTFLWILRYSTDTIMEGFTGKKRGK